MSVPVCVTFCYSRAELCVNIDLDFGCLKNIHCRVSQSIGKYVLIIRFSLYTLSVINRVLPNLNTFIKVVLKREKLSEEAEASRARYELILKTMEEGHTPPRPVSFIGDDDSGYHSTKPKGRRSVIHCTCICGTYTCAVYMYRSVDVLIVVL